MDRIEQSIALLEIYESLRLAVEEAGGSSEGFTCDYLKKMTAVELLIILATNDIRFIYTEFKRKTS
jgi:hypothetical protein